MTGPSHRMLFDVASVAYAVAGVIAVVHLIRRWNAFWDATFDKEDQRVAWTLAIFVLWPPLVAVHELGHAAAVELFDGTVVSLNWRVYWGFVAHFGQYTATEVWAIALAGNLAGLVVGVAIALVGVLVRPLSRPLRYTMVALGLDATIFTLVAYPIMSVSGFLGDWTTIYAFNQTPVLSSLTLLLHASVLLALRFFWTRGRLRVAMFLLEHGLEEEMRGLRRALREDPCDERAHEQLAELFSRRGQFLLAWRVMRRRNASCQPAAGACLAEGEYAMSADRFQAAEAAFRRGIDVGPQNPALMQRLWASLGVSLVNQQRHHESLDALGRVVEPLASHPTVLLARGLARTQLGDSERATQDLRAVVDHDRADDAQRVMARRILGDVTAGASE